MPESIAPGPERYRQEWEAVIDDLRAAQERVIRAVDAARSTEEMQAARAQWKAAMLEFERLDRLTWEELRRANPDLPDYDTAGRS